jgi:group I intron endonuclease
MKVNPRTYPEIYKKSGIYMIKNIITGEKYIGSSVTLGKRWSSHTRHLERKIHCNPKLQSSYNKYGDEAFVFGVVEFTDVETLFDREQYYYDFHKPEFNLSTVAKSPFTGIKLSAEHKRKCSLALIGKNKGLKRSEETKNLLRNITIEKGNKPLLDYIKNKPKKKIRVWLDDSNSVLFNNSHEVMHYFDLGSKFDKYVYYCCNRGKLLDKFKIEYAND